MDWNCNDEERFRVRESVVPGNIFPLRNRGVVGLVFPRRLVQSRIGDLLLKMISPSKAPLLLVGVAAVLIVLDFFLPPIAQPLSYHNFADHREWLGIANFGDVMSNAPFALVGVWGLIALLVPGKMKFQNAAERWPYFMMFAGLILTAFGSGYYHLAPDNARLVWDRIPIMIAMMALVAAVIAERVNMNAGLAMLPVLEITGVACVLAWRNSELQGHGDLRFYAAMQIYAVLVLLLMLLVRSTYTRGSDLAVVVGFYVLAKIFEECDRQVFALGHFVSGHPLKHLAAAVASYWILRSLENRQVCAG